jgi:hypothetical protein
VQKNRVLAKGSAPGSSSSSKSLLWVKFTLFCGLVLLLSGGIFMTSRLGHALQFHASGNEATVRTGDGDWRVERPNEVGPGLPVYPDARLVLSGRSGLPTAPKHNQADVYTAIYYSTDPSEFVDNWYLKHLGPEFAHSNSADQEIPGILLDASISDNDIAFVGERGDQVRMVAIAPDSTGTKITLVRFTQRKAYQMDQTR